LLLWELEEGEEWAEWAEWVAEWVAEWDTCGEWEWLLEEPKEAPVASEGLVIGVKSRAGTWKRMSPGKQVAT
jgi:hypothetical protein